MWTPDAYEGRPPVVTGFIVDGPSSAAGIRRVCPVLLLALEPSARNGRRCSGCWRADARCILGRRRRRPDEPEAHAGVSSIAHGGYLLVASLRATGGPGRRSCSIWCLRVTNLTRVSGTQPSSASREKPMETLDESKGLLALEPRSLAGLLTVFLLSLAGSRPPRGSSQSGTYSARPCARSTSASPSLAC